MPPAYLLIAVTVMAVLYFHAPGSEIIPPPWNLMGAIPLLLGVILNVKADAAFRENQTTVKPVEAPTVLITTGVFRVSRHPMYLGMVLILLGMAILMGTISPFIVIPVFIMCMHVIFIKTEERVLKEHFGEAWLAYKEKVRQWI